MLQLFLHPPTPPTTAENETAPNPRIPLLQTLESIIQSLINRSEARNEARLWLCNTISSFHSITPNHQLRLFLDLVKSQQSKQDVAPQILRMIFDKRPHSAGRILARNCYLLEKFFHGNPRGILQWFDCFAGPGESGHRRGAKALSQFSFLNRDSCWEELEWKGKHGQSPAIVATKPHYFQDLDVLRTVENFLEYVPDFWSSDELAESIKDGEILKLDTKYFAEQFVKMMYKEKSEDIWVVIEEFLMEEKFSALCQQILILLDDSRLLAFLNSTKKYASVKKECKDLQGSSCWLENLLLACRDEITLGEIVLLNAVITQGRQLRRLLADEEHEEEQRKINTLLETTIDFNEVDHWNFMKECIKLEHQVAIKWIGLQSWVMYYTLFRECKSPESCETLFTTNKINFCKSDNYSLIPSDGSDSDAQGLARSGRSGGRKKKRDRKSKSKRRRYYQDESSSDELVGIATKDDKKDFYSGKSWLLSTDGFSCSWSSADLPEHLSMHCFKTWMKWFYSKCL